MFKLPTYEEVLSIVKNSEAFYMKKYNFLNNEIFMFSYRLASFQDFKKFNAFELRGLTFVYNTKTKKYDRFIALNKFFNINQNEEWMEQDFKNNKIIKIDDKLDGSMISFILVNNKVYAKTKLSLESIQAVESQKIIDNNNILYNFIYDMINKDIMPIFEYVSPFNQIVLEYEKSELVLLQLRDMKTGKYINFNNIEIPFEIKIKKSEKLISLNELLILKNKVEKKEGWVITFDNGKMAKIKTEWYLKLHRIIGDNIMFNNILIDLILNEKIDDVIAELNKDSEKRIHINNVIEKVNKYFDHSYILIERLVESYYKIYKENKKEFAINNKNNEFFSIAISNIVHKKDIDFLLKEYILRKSNTLTKANLFLENI